MPAVSHCSDHGKCSLERTEPAPAFKMASACAKNWEGSVQGEAPERGKRDSALQTGGQWACVLHGTLLIAWWGDALCCGCSTLRTKDEGKGPRGSSEEKRQAGLTFEGET